MRSATAARLALGTLCTATPGRVLAAVGGPDQDDPHVTAVTRVLGARLLLQAVVDQVAGPRTRRIDVLVEVSHALSMVPVALVRPAHRRSSLVSAACAAGIALLDVLGAGGSQASRRLSRESSRSQR